MQANLKVFYRILNTQKSLRGDNMSSRLMMLAFSVPISLMIGCASEDSFRESIEVQVDGRQVLSSINQKSSKSAWEQDAELGALTESACSLPKEFSQAKANLTNKSSGQGLSQLSATVSTDKTSHANERRPSSTTGLQHHNQSRGYSLRESMHSQTTPTSLITKRTAVSSIKLQPLDKDTLDAEGVNLSTISNASAHLDLVNLLESRYGFKNNATFAYKKIMVESKSKSKLEVEQLVSIKEGLLTCQKITEQSVEIAR
jgi:hypothetical protein